jgi:hypothetical protein
MSVPHFSLIQNLCCSAVLVVVAMYAVLSGIYTRIRWIVGACIKSRHQTRIFSVLCEEFRYRVTVLEQRFRVPVCFSLPPRDENMVDYVVRFNGEVMLECRIVWDQRFAVIDEIGTFSWRMPGSLQPTEDFSEPIELTKDLTPILKKIDQCLGLEGSMLYPLAS